MGNTMSGKIGSFGKFSEKRTHKLQATLEPFPFMRLPPEIRNEIYRLVLLAQSVTTCCRTPREEADIANSIQQGLAIGTIRCKPWRSIRSGYWRMYTLEYQTAILRVSRQINLETIGIFHIENFWTLVWLNKAGFGKEMKNLGLPVAIVGDQWRYIRFPVMKVTVSFPSLDDQNQSEILLVAKVHLKHLVRALWTAKGASDMEVKIHIQPRLTNKSPTQRDLLEPFFKLRTIKKLVNLGVSQYSHMNELTRAITTTDGIDQTARELSGLLGRLPKYIRAGRWGHAIAQAERLSTLLEDCKIVFGGRFDGVEPGINMNTAIDRAKTSREIRVATALGLAEINIYLRRYAKTVRLVNCAKNLIDRPSTLSLGPINFEDEIIGTLFLIRARAFLGQGLAKPAWRDIGNARKLLLDAALPDEVSQIWHAMFGPSPCSSPSPSAAS